MSKRRSTICQQGHNKDEVGRTSQGSCRECNRLRNATERRRQGIPLRKKEFTVEDIRISHEKVSVR